MANYLLRRTISAEIHKVYIMAQEVNAAVAGAFDAGAAYVLVADSHGDAQNINPALLDGRAELIRAWPRPLGMMEGIDSSFAAAVFIGYHSSEGTPNAVLANGLRSIVDQLTDGLH